MSAEPLVAIEAASKTYVTAGGLVDALAPTDARIAAGSVTAVVGVSGSGKSTLLRLVAGHEAPSSGRVIVSGRDLATFSGRRRDRFRRETVTYVSQRAADNLFPQLNLAEHLRPGASLRPFEVLGIASRMSARPGELSGGELARASFAVALARGAPLVVVDEPTAELDRTTAGDVLAAMDDAASRGQTFVVATHDPAVIELAGDVLDLTRRRPGGTRAHVRERTPGKVALRLREVTKTYSGAAVIAGVSLDVREGELGLVFGRSGSGKSTLLMVAGGWIDPDRGLVEPALTNWRELAYVPQRFGLVPELTVEENVELPAQLVGAGPVAGLFERLAIQELRSRYPAQISIGQQQRVAIARALRLESRIVLVDEPTSHQDPMHAELVWAALGAAAEAGSACLVATHELDARHRADRWWPLEDGRLRAMSWEQAPGGWPS